MGFNEFCKHYHGMHLGKQCDAGILYEGVRSDRQEHHPDGDYPCYNPKIKTCDHAVYPTTEEIAAHETKIAQWLTPFQTDLDNDICPHCKTPIQHWQQVGRCVYAEPCGCRLYQGRVPKGKK